jgi:PPIC-type PPIASE domain
MARRAARARLEFADLVRTMSRTPRTLAHFLAIGVLVFVARRALSDDQLELAPLVVTVTPGASVDAAIDDAALLDMAIRAGWPRTDPVVRERLVRNMRFASQPKSSSGPGASDDALLEAALHLGMERRDPVTRQRLIQSADKLLVARATPSPSQRELMAYRKAHADDFVRPGALRLRHVFVSRDKRGEGFDARVEHVLVALERGERVDELADPMLHGTELGWMRPARLDAAFGAPFAEALVDVPAEQWSGPHRSSFGAHFFWVAERRPARLPPLTAIEAEVTEAYLRQASKRHRRQALDRLRQTYAIEVVR